MKYYIIVGWDKESKKMLYYGRGYWWYNITGAVIFDDVHTPVEYDENIERVFKMQVNFGKVEEIR